MRKAANRMMRAAVAVAAIAACGCAHRPTPRSVSLHPFEMPEAGAIVFLAQSQTPEGRLIELFQAWKGLRQLPEGGGVPCHIAWIIESPSTGALYVAEMTAPAFCITPLRRWLIENEETDTVWFSRPENPLNPEEKAAIWNYAESCVGQTYGYLTLLSFAVTSQPWVLDDGVCSEKGARSVQARGLAIAKPWEHYMPSDFIGMPGYAAPVMVRVKGGAALRLAALAQDGREIKAPYKLEAEENR